MVVFYQILSFSILLYDPKARPQTSRLKPRVYFKPLKCDPKIF